MLFRSAESGEDDENYVAVNNLAVVLLNQGRLQEVRLSFFGGEAWASCSVSQAIELLETALRTSPATIVTAEPFLFNICELAVA